MRPILLSLLLVAIAANGFCEEVENNVLLEGGEEPRNEIETPDVDKALSKNEVLITAPEIKGTVIKNELRSPGQEKVLEKKGKARKPSEGLKKVTKKIASGVKEGAKLFKEVKQSAKALKEKLIPKRKD